MSPSELPSSVFKQCPLCGFRWESRGAFLSDPGLTLIGYQACFHELKAGSFLFNHACEGTLGLRVEVFADLYDGPVYTTRQTGTSACPQYCLHQSELARCPAQCECAFVREIIQLLRAWPKDPTRRPVPA